jgi:hypothetical protein
MDETSSKEDAKSTVSDEKQVLRSSGSSSSEDYELVDNSIIAENNEKVISTPVLENLISEDLINDAMINSPSSNNVVVGKSIFYDCRDEKSKSEEKLSDTDEGM